MDKIFIRNLATETTIGIYDWERDVRQKVLIDLELAVDASASALTDSISHTFDYAEISQQLLIHIEASNCFLIETLAEELAGIIIDQFKADWVKLSLTKPGALDTASEVGVVIERSRSS